jgi:hypothetical protein
MLNTKYVFLLSLQRLFEILLFLRRPDRDMIKYVYWSSSKELEFLLEFNVTRIFPDGFSKNNQIPNLEKICPMEPSCSMRTDRRTDRHNEANSRFSQF